MLKLRREVVCPHPIRPPKVPRAGSIFYAALFGIAATLAIETYALHVVEGYASQPAAVTTR